MRDLYELKETLMDSLEDFDTLKSGELKMGELEALNYLTDTIKNIDKICLLEEDGEYSQAGDYEMDGRRGGGRGGDYSSRRGGGRGGRSNYDGGSSYRRGQRRDSMGRYSRDGGKEDMMEHIDMMMEEAPDERTRELIRSFKQEIKNV